jgi:long-chain acyl-CoA synthetase
MYEHLALLIRNRIEKYGKLTALRYKKEDQWHSISWEEMGKQIDAVAKALLECGVPEKGKVAIFSQNMPEWTIADFGIYSIRGVSVPIFATNTAEQAEYIINEAEISLVFVGEQEQYDKIAAISGRSKYLKHIVIFEDTVIKTLGVPSVFFNDFIESGRNSEKQNLLRELLKRTSMDDLASLIYTSGTTGEPKGVMLNHSNFIHALEIHDLRIQITDKDSSLSFLPLSHIFERTWVYYVLHKGLINNYLREPKKVIDIMQEVKPSVMCVVPRFFEKTYNGALTALENSSKLKRDLFNWAIETGKKSLSKKSTGQPLPFGLAIKNFFANKVILKKGRAVFGGRIKFMPCAGAAISTKILEFFCACGVNIKFGYGLTETTATVSCFEDTAFNLNSVGTVMPTIEVKINESNNEILVKGKIVTQGYYMKPDETAAAFEDGWFKTGDAGSFDENGYLVMTERIKDIIKTSGGKYIAPQYVENIIGCDPLIDQIAIIGDNRKYLTALIVPAFDNLASHARQQNLPISNNEDLISNLKIKNLYAERIKELQAPLADYQKIKKFELLPNPFSIESGELTPSLKIKRKMVDTRYKILIDEMYKED